MVVFKEAKYKGTKCVVTELQVYLDYQWCEQTLDGGSGNEIFKHHLSHMVDTYSSGAFTVCTTQVYLHKQVQNSALTKIYS